MLPHVSEKAPLLPTAASSNEPTPPSGTLTATQRCRRAFLPTLVFLAVLSLVWAGEPCDVDSPALPAAASASSSRTGLDGWIDAQERRSFEGVLANIGADGSRSGAEGAKAGIVIASPSTSAPNYLYTWTRDAALVSKALLDKMRTSGNTTLGMTLKDYAAAQSVLQHVDNPSGTFETGGLGEPKFNIDLTAFTENWGRPQRDGPALRATTLIGYANHLSNSSSSSSAYVSSTLLPIIEADLNYVQAYWNRSGFDLWEEVRGSSFFTTAVQHRALVEGATFFAAAGRPRPTYTTSADSVLCFLQSYWSKNEQYMVSNVNAEEKRSGLDGNSILASIHTFDSGSTTCDRETFQPCSDRALANHKAVVDSFRELYDVNRGIAAGAAVALGRYSEDVYYGGHPWYLITLAAAEQLYDALFTWDKAGSISITTVSLPFFGQIYPDAKVGSFASETKTYVALLRAVREYADGFFTIVEKYTPKDGSLAEQFDRSTGKPLSAADLTWSYAAFVTAAAARQGDVPLSWHSGGGAPACSAAQSTTAVLVTFEEVVSTTYGEDVHIVGSLPELGNWDPVAARRLTADAYTAEHPIWSRSIYLPPATHFEYKFIRTGQDGTVRWESGPNRALTTTNPGDSQVVGAIWH